MNDLNKLTFENWTIEQIIKSFLQSRICVPEKLQIIWIKSYIRTRTFLIKHKLDNDLNTGRSKSRLICHYCRVFRLHSKSAPFENQTHFKHLNSSKLLFLWFFVQLLNLFNLLKARHVVRIITVCHKKKRMSYLLALGAILKLRNESSHSSSLVSFWTGTMVVVGLNPGKGENLFNENK